MRLFGTRRALFGGRPAFLDLTWNVDAAGNWSTPGNWTGGRFYPNGVGNIARFLTVITANRIVTVDVPITIGQVFIADGQNYTISGTPILTFNNAGSNSILNCTSTGTPTISTPLSLSGTLAATITPTTTLSGIISGSGSIAKDGTGTLTLSAANTFTGSVAVSDGKLSLSHASAIASASSTTVTGTGSIALVGVTIAGKAITISGSGVNSFGALQTTSGTGVWTGSVVIGATSTRVGADTGTLEISGVVSASTTHIVVVRNNTGSTIFSGANTYTGQTQILVGNLTASSLNNVSGGTASSNLGAPTTAGNGTIKLGSGANSAGLVYAGSGETTDRVVDLGMTAGVTATLDQSGTGNLKFTSAFTATGSGAKTLALQGSTAGTGEITGVIVDSGGGATAITKAGSGTWKLGGANTFTGAVAHNGGTLQAGASTTVYGTATAITLANTAGVILDLNGFNVTIGSLSGGGGTGGNITLGSGTLTIGTSATTYSGIISGTGGISKINSSTLVFAGVNTYSGKTTITGGAISISADSGLGTAPGGVVADQISLGGTLVTTAGFTLNSNRGITLTGTAPTISVSSGTLTYNGIITGSPSTSFNKTSGGSLTLGGTNTYTVPTNIVSGTLTISADANLGTAPGSPVAAQIGLGGGTLNTTANFTLDSNRGTTLTANGTFSVNSATTLTYNGIITGAFNLTKSSTGTMILGGVNTYTGSTTLNTGTISISSDSNLGTAPGSPVANSLVFNSGAFLVTSTMTLNSNRGITLTSNSTITVNTSVVLTYGGIITGAFNLSKANAGTLILGGINTNTGAITVSTGSLFVNGSTHASAAVTVSSAAILGGTGTINGTTTISSGGIYAPGVSSTPGTLTHASNVTFTTTTGTWNIDCSGSTTDTSAITGNITLAGTITVNFTGTLNAGTYTFATYSGSLTGSTANLTIGTVPAGRTFVAFVAAAGIVTVQFS